MSTRSSVSNGIEPVGCVSLTAALCGWHLHISALLCFVGFVALDISFEHFSFQKFIDWHLYEPVVIQKYNI